MKLSLYTIVITYILVNSMRANTIAAGARLVTCAFYAPISAAASSLRMRTASRRRHTIADHEPIQHRQRERLQAVDDELRAAQGLGGIAVGDADAPQPGAGSRFEAPLRILDRDASMRLQIRPHRVPQPREGEQVRRRRRLAVRRIAGRDDRGKEIRDARGFDDLVDLMAESA